MNSIFREKIIWKNYEQESNSNIKYDKTHIRKVTEDNGILRARNYSLQSKIHFTEYKGYTIRKLIETDFNYFTWLPRNIENFSYDKQVLEYAETCITFIEKIENYPINKTRTDLGKAISQVDAMLLYENCLDYENDENMLKVWKDGINVEYYKTILNSPLERLIRQTRKVEQISSEYRRKNYNKITEK